MYEFFHNPIVTSAILGFAVAAAVDFQVWKTWNDVAFNWRIASYRWLVGALLGALSGAGYSLT
jgi:hypothetical protein